MSYEPLLRKWIPIINGSCDVRMGPNALEQASTVFKGCVGMPRKSMVVLRRDLDEELVERLRRQLVDAGFSVCYHRVGAEANCGVEDALVFAQALAQEQITVDDLCVAVGDASLLSMAAYVCGSWCGGVALEAMPLDEVAFFEGALIPRSLDIGDKRRMVAVRPNVHHALLDLSLAISPLDSESARYTRALMVSSAVIGSEREFSTLWDSAEALMADDAEVLSERLFSAAKIRGQTVGSTALAVRQALDYGTEMAGALERLTQGTCAPSVALAEGMRFAARLSVAQEKLELDDMLAQDELLDMLGIGELECDFDPRDLVAALKGERFSRSNRFMVALPLGFGRVRMSAVEDELLCEHAAAWCAAHR